MIQGIERFYIQSRCCLKDSARTQTPNKVCGNSCISYQFTDAPLRKVKSDNVGHIEVSRTRPHAASNHHLSYLGQNVLQCPSTSCHSFRRTRIFICSTPNAVRGCHYDFDAVNRRTDWDGWGGQDTACP